MTELDEQYQVTIVKYGTRTTRRSDVFLNYALYQEDDSNIEMDYFFWVARNGSRTIVIDTGFSPEGGRSRNRTLLADVPTLFRSFGAEPETVPTVVLTHAHYDHAGNLAAFTAASVVMARREFEFWNSPHAKQVLFCHSIDDNDLARIRLLEDEGRLTLFEGAHALAPGIELVEIGGHTPGQSVVKVRTSEGPVLLASDAIHYYEEFEREMPFTSVANIVEMYEGFSRIREWIASGEVVHLVAGHDPGTLARFAPVTSGPYRHLAATIGGLDA